MAHWQDCVVTDVGIEMLNELMAGRRLTITGAYGCEGKADSAALESLEDLTGDKRKLDLLDVVNGQAGKTVKIQINNSNLEESWRLEQIGIFARVDEEGERLLFVMQDEKGVEIPTQAENPSFILEIYGDIEITNDVEFHVDLAGSGAIVTPIYLAEVVQSIQPQQFAVTIPAKGWLPLEDTGSFFLDLPAQEAAEEIVPQINLWPGSIPTAAACGMAPCVMSLDGALRLYAQAVPDKDMQASVMLFKAGNSFVGGGIPNPALPVAAADRLGGVMVKPGSGLKIDTQGNLEIDDADSDTVAQIFMGSKAPNGQE